MRLEFKKGTEKLYVDVKDSNLSDVLLPSTVADCEDSESAVRKALDNPIGTPSLKEIVKPGEKISIITSDITRPMPTWLVMPQLLDELYSAGVKKEDITLVFALGSHRKHTLEEMKHLAGERAFNEIKCRDMDVSSPTHIGTTKKGTPVDIDAGVAAADRRICLGNLEYHYFAGYSGGAKAIMPGVSTRDAIQANHSMMTDQKAFAGNVTDNPIRLDIEEAASMVGVDFILNVVLNSSKQIVKAFAGDMILAHREGCRFLDQMYKKSIKEKADIVIVSQGGAPKDLNLYQTQKALDNAKHAVKDGGTIILVGSCHEGFGEKTFEEWFTSAPNPHSLIERIEKDFKLGGHKAAAIAMVMEKASIYLVSDFDDALVKKIFMTPFKSVQEAYDNALQKYGPNAKVIAMPYGGSTLPCNIIL